MRYSTNYSLSTDCCCGKYEQLVDTLWEVTEYSWGTSLELYDVKWYAHEKDMRQVSYMFPEVTFTLEGDGEDQGDQWRKYFKGGKMQHVKAVITFEDYDEGKLK